MTIHTDQPSPEQTGTWEPDYEAILDCYWGQSGRPELDWINEGVTEGLQAVISEYRRQQAAQGIVEVSADDAQTAGGFAIDAFKATYSNGTTDVLDAVYDCCFRVYEAGRRGRLAAAKDQDR